MKVYLREFRNFEDLIACFREIGPDPVGEELMREKAGKYSFFIRDVRSPVANIMKQEMLASGGDAVVSRGAVVCSEDNAPVLLMGSIKELRRGAKRFKRQYFGLGPLGVEMEVMLDNISKRQTPMEWKWNRHYRLDFDRPLIMGILNVTPDSFSDGGRFLDAATAVKRAERMIEEGANIIDVGGESTRPFSEPVGASEEIERVIPVIKEISGISDVPISIDTSKPEVAEKALDAGASMINDVYAAKGEGMTELIADTGTPIILMHMLGEPKTMQENINYTDVMDDIADFFRERISHMQEKGVNRNRIIIDPGIGFGKTARNNLEILGRLGEMRIFGLPIMAGPSRKSFIGAVTGREVDDRLYGSLSAAIVSMLNGANILRVHDVSETRDALLMAEALLKKRMPQSNL